MPDTDSPPGSPTAPAAPITDPPTTTTVTTDEQRRALLAQTLFNAFLVRQTSQAPAEGDMEANNDDVAIEIGPQNTDNNENIAQSPRVQVNIESILTWFMKRTAIFLLIIIANVLVMNIRLLAMIILFEAMFSRLNAVVKDAIASRGRFRSVFRRILLSLALLIAYSIMGLAFCIVAEGPQFWRRFALLPPVTDLSFLESVMHTVGCDYIIRGLFMGLKVGLSVMSTHLGPILSLTEGVSLLYRAILPIPVWIIYFSRELFGPQISIILYLFYKLVDIGKNLRMTVIVAFNFVTGRKGYGRIATESDIQETDGCCAICQEEYRNPVALTGCRHVFCDECILSWLSERQQTCPLCRAELPASSVVGTGRDGRTDPAPYIF